MTAVFLDKDLILETHFMYLKLYTWNLKTTHSGFLVVMERSFTASLSTCYLFISFFYLGVAEWCNLSVIERCKCSCRRMMIFPSTYQVMVRVSNQVLFTNKKELSATNYAYWNIATSQNSMSRVQSSAISDWYPANFCSAENCLAEKDFGWKPFTMHLKTHIFAQQGCFSSITFLQLDDQLTWSSHIFTGLLFYAMLGYTKISLLQLWNVFHAYNF